MLAPLDAAHCRYIFEKTGGSWANTPDEQIVNACGAITASSWYMGTGGSVVISSDGQTLVAGARRRECLVLLRIANAQSCSPCRAALCIAVRRVV